MDEEEFLLLDDEEEVNTPSKEKFKMIKNGDSSWQKVGNAISNIPFKIKESSDMKESIRNNIDNLIPFAKSANLVLDADLAVDGTYDIEWNINGMDCTDCAMKAKRAVNRLPGVNSVNMSVTEGTVTLNLDLARGSVSRANLVLQNLGHDPIIPWQSVSGITPTRAASNLEIERKVLRNTLLEVPGIINVRFGEGKIEFQRINFSSLKMKEIADERLQQLLGNNLKFQTSNTSKLRMDQVQLLSAVFTIPLLMGVIAINQLDYVPNVFALLLSLIGISFAGFPMFKAAVASIQNKFLGFQVLTSLAVIGAMLMQHYTEALIVTGLVAFASHLEESALVRARNAMQGGLDRLPRLARLSSSEEEWLPIEALNVGDDVEIRSGEIIPVDGIIMDGSGAIDRAPLTGEPIPVSITKGDFVEAGLV